ncbi:glycosyltransferase [Bizionia saleffrena]|uniref:Glycosyltransferase n=1 Tax=Bizionia saleffrena TaxID=291189 RepID=A0A8H2QKJ6_9FLAO|nr:galactosyltransferase-related protein [Bizionia saleffrena]TYB80165.1 glycosyltransferase [Bizionia saleffrena]
MITIILTYRNRDLNIVKKCLASLGMQDNTDFQVILIDYGSVSEYKEELCVLVENYSFVTLLRCETEQQLWCKSRAINIALKTVKTPYCFIGDIDMIYHPRFINVVEKEANKSITTYFQVGFLSKTESKKETVFNDYEIAFKSQKKATGMTLYNTELLKSINGYDEFYNGWGSEDTDVHMRLQNVGHQVNFYTKQLLMLHQWHPKNYRTKNDVTPFHSTLEQINTSYLNITELTKKVEANTMSNWGCYNKEDYDKLKSVDESYSISNKTGELIAFINGILLLKKDIVLRLEITTHKDYNTAKQKTKALLGKKTMAFDDMQMINDNLLECIIRNLRNQAYQYQFNTVTSKISLIIKL